MGIPTQYLRSLAFKPGAEDRFGEFPFTLPAIRDLERVEFHPKVTFFVGENGSGKSTLLEALAVAAGMNPEGGTTGFNFGTRESHSALHKHLRLVRGIRKPKQSFFLRAESYFNLATEIERLDAIPDGGPKIGPSFGDRELHEQSHGESFMALLKIKLRGRGLYLFDEPEAALSPQKQMTLVARIHELAKANSQFVIATHSPIVMAYPDAVIYEFSADGLRKIAYEETEHYRVTRDFLMNPKRSLEILMRDENDLFPDGE